MEKEEYKLILKSIDLLGKQKKCNQLFFHCILLEIIYTTMFVHSMCVHSRIQDLLSHKNYLWTKCLQEKLFRIFQIIKTILAKNLRTKA